MITTPERIARNAFGSADWLKLQSQHERFLREIENLPEDEKAVEMLNAVKYLLDNKSDYWLEISKLLHFLIEDGSGDRIGYCSIEDIKQTYKRLETMEKDLQYLLRQLEICSEDDIEKK